MQFLMILLSSGLVGLGLDADLLYQILFYLWIIIRNKKSPGILLYIQVTSFKKILQSSFVYSFHLSASSLFFCVLFYKLFFCCLFFLLS